MKKIQVQKTLLTRHTGQYIEHVHEHVQCICLLVRLVCRYAVKLLYDEAVLGEISDFTELQESLEEYDNHWYIAQEEKTADDWRRNIINETRSLFSMGFTEPVMIA